MIKKVLCLLLVLACSVSLFACNITGKGGAAASVKEGEGGNQPGAVIKPGDSTELIDDKTSLMQENAFFAGINNSDPAVITTVVWISNSLFEEFGPCQRYYKDTILEDGSYSFYYWEEFFDMVGEDDDENPKRGGVEDAHTILYKDGEYFFDGVKTAEASDLSALSYKFDINTEYISGYTISEDGTKLTAKVSADSISDIFGVKIDATSQVDFTVEINGSKLYKITIDYVNGLNQVNMVTTFTY